MTDEEKKIADEKLAKDIENARLDLKKTIKKHGEETQELKNRVDKMVDENTKKEKEYIEAKEEAEKRNKELEDGLNENRKRLEEARQFSGKSEGRTPEQKAQIDALNTYARESDINMIAKHEQKTYVVGTDAAAGYLQVPPFYAQEIIDQAAVEITPAMRLANTITISGNEYQVPAVTAHAVATRVDETGTTSEDTTLAVGKEFIRVDYLTVLLKASLAMLSDSNYPLETLFRNQVAQAFNKKVGTEFCTGNGSTQMEGITINADITTNNVVNSGSASTLTAGGTSGKGLNGLYWNPKSKYMSNPAWLMRRATMMVAYGLVDGQGQYLLRFGLNQLEGRPVWSIMGSMVEECADMPAISSNSLAIGFGDFKLGYKIVNSSSMTMLRDPFTSKTTNVVEFMFWLRNGGGVVLPEAIHLQKIAA